MTSEKGKKASLQKNELHADKNFKKFAKIKFYFKIRNFVMKNISNLAMSNIFSNLYEKIYVESKNFLQCTNKEAFEMKYEVYVHMKTINGK